MPSGCRHFVRGCKLYAKCCDIKVWCHLCHDDMNYCKKIKNIEVDGIVCTHCETKQPASRVCINEKCGKEFSKTYCSQCNVWDDETRHCGACGYCVRRDFVHCNKCKKCYLTIPNMQHICFSKIPSKTSCYSCKEPFQPISSSSIVLSPCKTVYYHAECLRQPLFQTGSSKLKIQTLSKAASTEQFHPIDVEWEGAFLYLHQPHDPTRRSVHLIKMTVTDNTFTVLSEEKSDKEYSWSLVNGVLNVKFDDEIYSYPESITIKRELIKGDRVQSPDKKRCGTIYEGSWNAFKSGSEPVSILWDGCTQPEPCELGNNGKLDCVKEKLKPQPFKTYPDSDRLTNITGFDGNTVVTGSGLIYSQIKLNKGTYTFVPPGWVVSRDLTPYDEEYLKENWGDKVILVSDRYVTTNTPAKLLSELQAPDDAHPELKLTAYSIGELSTHLLVIETTHARWSSCSREIMSDFIGWATDLKTNETSCRLLTDEDIASSKTNPPTLSLKILLPNIYLQSYRDAETIHLNKEASPLPCPCHKPSSTIVVTTPDPADLVSETCQTCWKSLKEPSNLVYINEKGCDTKKAYCSRCSPSRKVGVEPIYEGGAFTGNIKVCCPTVPKIPSVVWNSNCGVCLTLEPVKNSLFAVAQPLSGVPEVEFQPLEELHKDTKIEPGFINLSEYGWSNKKMAATTMSADTGRLVYDIHFCNDVLRNIKVGFASVRHDKSLQHTCLIDGVTGEILINGTVVSELSPPAQILSTSKITCTADLNENVIFFTVDGVDTKSISTIETFGSPKPILFPFASGSSCYISVSFKMAELLRTTEQHLCCIRPSEMVLKCGPWSPGSFVAYMCPVQKKLMTACIVVPPVEGVIVVQNAGEACLQTVELKSAVPVTRLDKNGQPCAEIDTNGRLTTQTVSGQRYCGQISSISREGYCEPQSPCWHCLGATKNCSATPEHLSSSIRGKSRQLLTNTVYSKINRTFKFQTPLEYFPSSQSQEVTKCIALQSQEDGSFYTVVTFPQGVLKKGIPSALLREASLFSKGDRVLNKKTSFAILRESSAVADSGVCFHPYTIIKVEKHDGVVLCQIQLGAWEGWVSEDQLLPADNLLFTRNNEGRFAWFNKATEQFNCWVSGTCGCPEACRSCLAITQYDYPLTGGFECSSRGTPITFSSSTDEIAAEPLPAEENTDGWSCSACTFHNEPDAEKCSICETAKPEAEPAPVKETPPKETEHVDDKTIIEIGSRVYVKDKQCFGWVTSLPKPSSYSQLVTVYLSSGDSVSIPASDLRAVKAKDSKPTHAIDNLPGSRVLFQNLDSKALVSGVVTSLQNKSEVTSDAVVEIEGESKIKASSVIHPLPPIPVLTPVLVFVGEHAGRTGTLLRYMPETERYLIRLDSETNNTDITVANIPFVTKSTNGSSLEAWIVPISYSGKPPSISCKGHISWKTASGNSCISCCGGPTCDNCLALASSTIPLGATVTAKTSDGSCTEARVIAICPNNYYLVWSKAHTAKYQAANLRLNRPSQESQFAESFMFKALWEATCLYHQVYDIVDATKKPVPEVVQRASSVRNLANAITNWSSKLLFRGAPSEPSDKGVFLAGRTLPYHPTMLIFQYTGQRQFYYVGRVCKAWYSIMCAMPVDFKTTGSHRGKLVSCNDRIRLLRTTCSHFNKNITDVWSRTIDTLYLEGSNALDEANALKGILGGPDTHATDDTAEQFTERINDLCEIDCDDYEHLVKHLVSECTRQCGRDRPANPIKYIIDYLRRVAGFRTTNNFREFPDSITVPGPEPLFQCINSNLPFYNLTKLTLTNFSDEKRSVSPVDKRIFDLPNLKRLFLEKVPLNTAEVENIVRYGQKLTELDVSVPAADVAFAPTFLKILEQVGMPKLIGLSLEYGNMKVAEVKTLAACVPHISFISLKSTCTDESDVSMAEALSMFRDAKGIIFSHTPDCIIKPCSCYRDFAQDAAMLATLPKCDYYIVPWEVLPGLRFVDDASRISDLRCTVGTSPISDCLVMLGNLTTLELHGFNPTSEDEFCVPFEANSQLFFIDLGFRPHAMKHVTSNAMRRLAKWENKSFMKLGLYSTTLSDESSWFPFSSSSLLTFAMSKPSFGDLVLTHSLVNNYSITFLASAVECEITCSHCPYLTLDLLPMLRRIPRSTSYIRVDIFEEANTFINGISVDHQDPTKEE